MKKTLLIALILLLSIAALALYYARPSSSVLTIGQTRIPVEVVSSDTAVRKGLSGRASLADSAGMLFLFNAPDYYRFWMPDMRFPIDIIWMRDDRVVDISENVSNEFDPQNPRYYIPKEKAQYVLEVNAGFAQKNNIRIGDTVALP